MVENIVTSANITWRQWGQGQGRIINKPDSRTGPVRNSSSLSYNSK